MFGERFSGFVHDIRNNGETMRDMKNIINAYKQSGEGKH